MTQRTLFVVTKNTETAAHGLDTLLYSHAPFSFNAIKYRLGD